MRRFTDAFNGIFQAIKLEKNIKIHLFVAILVIISGLLFNISLIEWNFIILSIALVLAAEVFNTSIENLCDFVEPKFNEKIGLIKDLAAGAVLILSLASLIVGLIIFIPKIIYYA